MARRRAARAALQLLVLFAIGLLAGVWTFIAPWIVAFPTSRYGGWTSSTWSTVWVAAIVIGASAIGLVTALGLALSAALRPRATPPAEVDGT